MLFFRSFSAMNPLEFYTQQSNILTDKIKKAGKRKSIIALGRGLSALATIGLVVLLWQQPPWIITLTAAIGIGCFLFFVSKDADCKQEIDNLKKLLFINEEEIKIIAGNFMHRETGQDFAPANHAYANDLDIFGNFSLYQYINRCISQQGKSLLAAMLLNGIKENQITTIQEAVKEITIMPEWRQQFSAYAMGAPVTSATQQNIQHWMELPDIYTERSWNIIKYVFPVLTIASVVLNIYDVIDNSIFYPLVLAFTVFAFAQSKKINNTWKLLSGIVPQAESIYQQMQHAEQADFKSTYLQNIYAKAKHGSVSASVSIKELKKILDRFEVRLNVLAFFLLNTFLLWDVWQITALNKWKQQNKNSIKHWFDCIAVTEYIISLSTLGYNQPAWAFPEISGVQGTIEATAITHPLLPADKAVKNSFTTTQKAKVTIVTGSNMAGKSTFLRSIGTNMVLACMGAPVCASSFVFFPAKLMTSMRIADNLAESTSTFYAELKKLKEIITAVNAQENIFILLDEILRGTNSLDRHTGSAALIRQLIHQKACGIIATHDIELAKLENDFPQNIANFHFDVQVSGEELYFDYKLKRGICNSLNASLLMKKIGIDL